MRPEVQLISGCFLLGAVVAYGLWSRIRVDLLRLELARVRDRLGRAMGLRLESDHSPYLRQREMLDGMIEAAPYLSALSLILFVGSGWSRSLAGFEAQAPRPRTLEDMPKVVEEAIGDSWVLLFRYCLFGCISGWLSLPILWLAMATGRLRGWIRDARGILNLVAHPGGRATFFGGLGKGTL